MATASRDELIDELRRVANDLGETPSANDVRKHGRFPVSLYRSRFGSWNEAVSEAGFTPRSVGEPIPSDELITELQRLAQELGRSPSATDMKREGEYTTDAYRNHFGSWNQAIEAAGLDPTPECGERLQRDTLLDELQRLAGELDHPPTTADMRKHGKYSVKPYYKHFESWEAALESAGIVETA